MLPSTSRPACGGSNRATRLGGAWSSELEPLRTSQAESGWTPQSFPRITPLRRLRSVHQSLPLRSLGARSFRNSTPAHSKALRTAAKDDARYVLPVSMRATPAAEVPAAAANLYLLQPSEARAARSCSGETPRSMANLPRTLPCQVLDEFADGYG
jgi:hypothetical protein